MIRGGGGGGKDREGCRLKVGVRVVGIQGERVYQSVPYRSAT